MGQRKKPMKQAEQGKSKKLAVGGLAFAALVALVGLWGLLARPGEASGTRVTMYRSPGCGCCEGWRKHMEGAGFDVDVVATERIYEIKVERGVPQHLTSCHTAIIEGHLVEGHVPAQAVRWMLEGPDGPAGIAAGGMPNGSPGMSGAPEPFDVVTFEDGRAGSVYAVYGLGGSIATEGPLGGGR